MECCLPLYLNTEGIREIEKGGRVGLPPTVSEYRDIKTDRKSLNIEGEWGQGGDRLLSTSVSEYRDIRDIEKGGRVGLPPTVYMNTWILRQIERARTGR